MFMESKEKEENKEKVQRKSTKKKSVKKEIINVQEKIKSQKKKDLIFVISMVGIIVVLLVVSTIISDSKIDATHKIAEKISNELKDDYDKITFVEEKEDTEYKYSYVSSTLIYIDSIGSKEDGKFAVAVSKYNSNAEALKKEEFINEYNKLAHKKFDNTVAELVDDYDNVFMNNVILVKGKYLFSINPKVKNQSKLINNIEKIVEDYDISDISKVDENALNKYWKSKLTSIEKELDGNYKQIVEDVKKQIKKEIDNIKNCSTITKCKEILESSKSYEKYDDLSEELNQLNEEYKKKVITVVDFSTMSKQDAENWCKEQELVCSTRDEYSDTVANNGFISQSKEANGDVLKGDSITITYSMGKKPTQSQLNALSKAQSYSDRQYMSKNRLYRQLTSSYGEGFSAEDAQYAINHVRADWNYNALQKGKSYYTRQNMSKSRVYQQLVSSYGEDFTPEQAQYAVDHLDD